MEENVKKGKNIKFNEKTIKRIDAMTAFKVLDGLKLPKAQMMSEIVEEAVNFYFEQKFRKELESL
ncbi:hypothetical protein [Sulfurimonas sp.]|uniref:hypothetical protein n=1 Tax=Sulfurimonas sp. TaxID=2022749 RepID=UPI0019ECCAEF|nr:hypothetical protein [Sulfurimonas sp.]MBE0515525.1 hypothetical protein [Sulfurimonas sp.]